MYIGDWKISSAYPRFPPFVLPLCEIKAQAAPLCIHEVPSRVRPTSPTGSDIRGEISALSPRAALHRLYHDSTPYRVFKIGELTRLIASQLIPHHKKSAVNLACACRYLEEPVLSTLWETQWSLCTLLETLPRNTWGCEYPGFDERVVRGLYLPLEEFDG